MNEYASYESLRTYLGFETGDNDEDDLLRELCTIASRMIDGATGRTFYPRTETRYYDMPFNSGLLKLDDDLLEVTTFTTQNDGETVVSTDYYLMCGGVYNLTPYDRIAMKRDGTRPNLLYSGTVQKSQKVIGVWGYHESWDDAWQDSNDTVQDAGGINASVATLTVTDVDGADIYNIEPRFRAQMLLKIGDEYVYVTRKNTTANTLTIRRGVNGTTAAVHANGVTIYVYHPMEEIENAAKRLTKWLYQQKDSSLTDEQGTEAVGGIFKVPQSAPVDVKLVLVRYKRRVF